MGLDRRDPREPLRPWSVLVEWRALGAPRNTPRASRVPLSVWRAHRVRYVVQRWCASARPIRRLRERARFLVSQNVRGIIRRRTIQLENGPSLLWRLAESRGDKLPHFGATRYKPPPRLRPPPAPRQSPAAGGGATPAARHVGMLFAGRPLASPYWGAPSAAMRLLRVNGTLARSLRLCGYCNPGA